jgi:hypothetical protein
MSSPRIIFDTELLEDSITRLLTKLGFRIRLLPAEVVPEALSADYVRAELRAISETRMRLLEIMRDDIELTEHPDKAGRLFPRVLARPRVSPTGDASRYGPPARDKDGFLIDDGRYH